MKERLFRFKRFSVKHDRSAMKVGVDGVLIGAWVSSEGIQMLDVGTGCGLIALMLAQRNEKAMIEAIDIDTASVAEAMENVSLSSWSDRISVYNMSFDEWLCQSPEKKYDLIVSNPPFFDSGIIKPTTTRELARHQGTLSPKRLICQGAQLLKPDGRLALIAPVEMKEGLLTAGKDSGLIPLRICFVRNKEYAKEKRVMIEFLNGEGSNRIEPVEELLILFGPSGDPTQKYRDLCKDFYLKF